MCQYCDNKIDIKVARMEEKLDNLSTDFKEFKEDFKKHIENNDKRYASKWTERVIWVVLLLVVTGVVGGVLKLIIR